MFQRKKSHSKLKKVNRRSVNGYIGRFGRPLCIRVRGVMVFLHREFFAFYADVDLGMAFTSLCAIIGFLLIPYNGIGINDRENGANCS